MLSHDFMLPSDGLPDLPELAFGDGTAGPVDDCEGDGCDLALTEGECAAIEEWRRRCEP